jgi:hypothetical protein
MEGAGAMSKVLKIRVDQLLVERGHAESRTRAQALVLAGIVFSGETKLVKPGQTLPADATTRGFRAAGSSWRMRFKYSGSIRRALPRWISAVRPAVLPMCC